MARDETGLDGALVEVEAGFRKGRIVQRLATLFHDGGRLIRGSFFGYTSLLVLLGAGSVDPDPTGWQILTLIVIGLNYHLFGYIHNDLVDLPLDRTQPLRSNDPLVAGRITERQAWTVALAQIPLSYVVAWLAGASAAAFAVLTLGYASTVLYNVYGKRCPIPIITDAVQGVAWASLATFGALLVGEPTMLTWIPAAFGFGFIFLINGVHGGLRDLENDYDRGFTNTSIYLGARPIDGTRIRTTRQLQAFAFIAFSILLVPTAAAFALGVLPYGGLALAVVSVCWIATNVCSAWLLWQVVKIEQPDRFNELYRHQLPLLTPPLMVMLPALGGYLQATLLACFFLPFLLFTPIRWRFRSVSPSADPSI